MSGQQLLPQKDPEQEALRWERRAAQVLRRKQRRRYKALVRGTIGGSILLLALIGFLFLRLQTLLNTANSRPLINGISCDSVMHNNYHIHIHLSIYINGKAVTIPRYIGIDSNVGCFYWLHTHTSDGIVHIEALQKQHNLALDDFLSIWHDGFSNLNFPTALNAESGWKIYVNGKLFSGKVTSPLQTEVPLASHDIITLEYGPPLPRPDDATTYHFPTDLKQ